jgi:hypothetical protein
MQSTAHGPVDANAAVEATCLLEGVQAGVVVVCQVSALDGLAALRRLVALELDGVSLSGAAGAAQGDAEGSILLELPAHAAGHIHQLLEFLDSDLTTAAGRCRTLNPALQLGPGHGVLHALTQVYVGVAGENWGAGRVGSDGHRLRRGYGGSAHVSPPLVGVPDRE